MHRGDQGPSTTDEWLTPPFLIEALGPFDLDPCAPGERPWPTAGLHFTAEENGLLRPWAGRVWCNPPYGPHTWKWLNRLALHGNGIALIFARTETEGFHRFVFSAADSLLFLKGRLRFCDLTGAARGSAGAPSVLVAYGETNARKIASCGLPGFFVRLQPKSGT